LHGSKFVALADGSAFYLPRRDLSLLFYPAAHLQESVLSRSNWFWSLNISAWYSIGEDRFSLSEIRFYMSNR